MHAVEWKQYMSKTWFISNSFIAFWLFQVHSHYIFAIGKNCSKIAKRCVSVSVNVYLAMVKYTYFLPRYTVLFNTTLEPIHNFEWKKMNKNIKWMSRVSFRSFFFLWSRRENFMTLFGIVFHCNDKSSDYVSAYMCASWIYTCIRICICLFLFFYSIIHVHLTRPKTEKQ